MVNVSKKQMKLEDLIKILKFNYGSCRENQNQRGRNYKINYKAKFPRTKGHKFLNYKTLPIPG